MSSASLAEANHKVVKELAGRLAELDSEAAAVLQVIA
jgi:hypothetical protein